MKRLKNLFILSTMLLAGVSLNNANKMEVAEAYETGSYAYLNTSWASVINQSDLSQYSVNTSLFKTLLITNNADEISAREYLGSPIDIDTYKDQTSINAYIYPYVEDATYYDCIIYADVETIILPPGSSASGLFSNFSNLVTINFACKLSVKNVKNMSSMFLNDSSLVQIEGLTNVMDTTNVTTMRSMFSGCSSLTSIDVSSLDSSNVTDTGSMFNNCSSLTTIYFGNFDTSKVTSMGSMFNNCSSLTTIDLSGFDTSNVTSMSWMFHGCSSLTAIDVSNFNTANVKSMDDMFGWCKKLTTIEGLNKFKTSNVTNMSSMFSSCESLATIDVSSFDTTNVTNMRSMFSSCKKITTIDVSNFKTSNVTDMHAMFGWCEELTAIKGLEKFQTGNVTDMGWMFYSCDKLTEINVSKFDTSKVTDFNHMFTSCKSVKKLDLSNFDLYSVLDQNKLDAIFSSVDSIEEIKAPKNFVNKENESLVIYLPYVYKACGFETMDQSLVETTLLPGSKEFNSLYNALMKLKTCDDYMQAPELKTIYDGLSEKDKEKLSTLTDNDGVCLTDKLNYMVAFAASKATPSATAERNMVVADMVSQSSAAIIGIACLSLASIAGYYLIQKKKYAK